MRRIEMNLADAIWQDLQAQAETSGKTVPQLVEQAVQKEYMAELDRKEALLGIVGMWKDREDMNDPDAYIRNLRQDTRLERIYSNADPS